MTIMMDSGRVTGEHAPDGVDLGRANAARMYDYLLGGAHNFAVDREHVATLLRANPEVELLARSNRAYLGRLVRWCVARGIDLLYHAETAGISSTLPTS